MQNEHVIILGMGLLVAYLLLRSLSRYPGCAMIAAALSIILIAGAMRHPEVAISKELAGTQEEQLQATMLMVAIILGIPVGLWLLNRRGE